MFRLWHLAPSLLQALRVVAGEADALRGSIAFLKEAQTAVGAAA